MNKQNMGIVCEILRSWLLDDHQPTISDSLPLFSLKVWGEAQATLKNLEMLVPIKHVFSGSTQFRGWSPVSAFIEAGFQDSDSCATAKVHQQ